MPDTELNLTFIACENCGRLRKSNAALAQLVNDLQRQLGMEIKVETPAVQRAVKEKENA